MSGVKRHCFYCARVLKVNSMDAYHTVEESEHHKNDDGYILWSAKMNRGDSE